MQGNKAFPAQQALALCTGRAAFAKRLEPLPGGAPYPGLFLWSPATTCTLSNRLQLPPLAPRGSLSPPMSNTGRRCKQPWLPCLHPSTIPSLPQLQTAPFLQALVFSFVLDYLIPDRRLRFLCRLACVACSGSSGEHRAVFQVRDPAGTGRADPSSPQSPPAQPTAPARVCHEYVFLPISAPGSVGEEEESGSSWQARLLLTTCKHSGGALPNGKTNKQSW